MAGTDYVWPVYPDGAATFAIDEGGWYHVVNSEVFSEGAGGVSVLRYDADGEVVDAYALLTGSTANCAGGPTPWGTWLSGEEADGGQIWECDPATPDSGTAIPAMGMFHHEAAAVDPENERVYLTEDEPDGALYRFTPDAYPDLSAGLLEVASTDPDGAVTWYEVPDPSGANRPTRLQVPEVTAFNGGEGCWYADGIVYFTTKGDNHVRSLDPATDTITVVYDGNGLLDGVDNVTVESGSGDLYVAEDGGDMQVVVITAEGEVAPIAQISAEPLPPEAIESEVTGPVFSPDGTRLYFSSQRGGNTQQGITYEVTGPFRGIEAEEPAPTTTIAAANGSSEEAADTSSEDDGDSFTPRAHRHRRGRGRGGGGRGRGHPQPAEGRRPRSALVGGGPRP